MKSKGSHNRSEVRRGKKVFNKKQEGSKESVEWKEKNKHDRYENERKGKKSKQGGKKENEWNGNRGKKLMRKK